MNKKKNKGLFKFYNLILVINIIFIHLFQLYKKDDSKEKIYFKFLMLLIVIYSFISVIIIPDNLEEWNHLIIVILISILLVNSVLIFLNNLISDTILGNKLSDGKTIKFNILNVIQNINLITTTLFGLSIYKFLVAAKGTGLVKVFYIIFIILTISMFFSFVFIELNLRNKMTKIKES